MNPSALFNTVRTNVVNHPWQYAAGGTAAVGLGALAMAMNQGQPPSTGGGMAPTANDITSAQQAMDLHHNSAPVNVGQVSQAGNLAPIHVNRVPEGNALTDLDKLEARVKLAKQIHKHPDQQEALEKEQALDKLYANALGATYF